jgi:hypothetical protein
MLRAAAVLRRESAPFPHTPFMLQLRRHNCEELNGNSEASGREGARGQVACPGAPRPTHPKQRDSAIKPLCRQRLAVPRSAGHQPMLGQVSDLSLAWVRFARLGSFCTDWVWFVSPRFADVEVVGPHQPVRLGSLLQMASRPAGRIAPGWPCYPYSRCHTAQFLRPRGLLARFCHPLRVGMNENIYRTICIQKSRIDFD